MLNITYLKAALHARASAVDHRVLWHKSARVVDHDDGTSTIVADELPAPNRFTVRNVDLSIIANRENAMNVEHSIESAFVTKGHRADQPGLRGHSVGALYPYTVIGFGDGSWAAMDCRTGRHGRRWRTYAEAYADVGGLLVRNCINS